jgi:hypothetical protein
MRCMTVEQTFNPTPKGKLVQIARDLCAFFPRPLHLPQPYVVLMNARTGKSRLLVLDGASL